MLVLAGDIGGTRVRLALYGLTDGSLEVRRASEYAVKDYRGLEEIVRQFVGAEKVSVACLGAPGPRSRGKLRMANLPWILDGNELASTFGIQRVYLLNDLEALGYGIAKLSPDKIVTLNGGDGKPTGNRALIAAGTGLGESFLTWDGHGHVPHPSEGGHTDFAPRNDDEFDLLRCLRRKYAGRVSVERVVSGIGMANIYEFLRDVRGMEEPNWLKDEFAAAEDTNSVITGVALAGRSALCEKTLDMFVSAYGAEAGNFGLSMFSTGGLYIGGGIAPRILEKLKSGAFMQAFVDKGRLSRLLEAMPMHVILDSAAALKGAAACVEARIIHGEPGLAGRENGTR
jgi:glucokinase